MKSIKSVIPNSFTTGNLLGGILAIILVFAGRIDLAPWCIFASAIFDFFDGFLARMLKVDGELGKQLDSLADMVTFGVAPGIMIMGLLILSLLGDSWDISDSNLPELSFQSSSKITINAWIHMTFDRETMIINYIGISKTKLLIPFIGLLFPVFALFRLAKFNIDTRQSDSFIGLPTPGATLFFAVFPIILSGMDSTIFGIKGPTELLLNPYFLIISTLVIGILMVSELPLFALKFKNFKWKGNEARYIFLALSLILIITLYFWSIPVIIGMYLLLSVIMNLGKKKEAQATT